MRIGRAPVKYACPELSGARPFAVVRQAGYAAARKCSGQALTLQSVGFRRSADVAG